MHAPPAFRQQLLGAIPRLRRYARSLVFDPSAADDLVQTALERALSHWHQFDQRRDILLWTLSIAHNAFMDDGRRHARTPLVYSHNHNHAHNHNHSRNHSDSDDARGALEERHASHSPDIGLRLDLVAALQKLPVEQREPLLLVTLEQLSHAECAELLRVPIGTVMSRISRGRAALRALLEGRAPVATTAATRLPSSSPLRRVI